MVMMLIGMFTLAGCDNISFRTFQASDNDKTITPIAEVDETEEATDAKKKENNGKAENTDVFNDSIKASEHEEEVAVKEDKIDEVTPTPNAIQPIANIDLPVYTVNVDSGEVETVTALIPEGSKITPELIVNIVVESMADNSIEVGIESVTTKDKTVIVSFYQKKAPFVDFGSGYEIAILDAIAQSLIDNLKDYNKVIYRVEGKAYESGHIALGMDEIYLGDN
jgi:hypothetical protein